MKNAATSTAAETVGNGAGIAAQRLATAGMALLIVLPLAMWLANRSAPLMLGLAALCFLASALVGEGRAAMTGRLAAMLRDPLGLAIAGFLLWALVTIAWSHRPMQQGLAAWGELALPIACAAALVASGRFRPYSTANRWLALAITLAALLIMAELATGLAMRARLGVGRQMDFIFNRPVLTCLMLGVAALAALVSARPGWWPKDGLLASVLALVVGILALRADSGAAVLGALVIAAVWLAALILPRLALALVALGFVATLLVAPVMGRLGDAALPPAFHERLAQSHTRDRVDIWLSFGEAVMARPLLGSGFGTSPTLDRHPVAQQVSPEHRRLLAVGHPHNAPLQAWVETGVVGVALIGFAGLALLARLRGMRAGELAPRLALFAGAFAVAAVAHGAWQGWWAAILALAAAWLHATLRNPDIRG